MKSKIIKNQNQIQANVITQLIKAVTHPLMIGVGQPDPLMVGWRPRIHMVEEKKLPLLVALRLLLTGCAVDAWV